LFVMNAKRTADMMSATFSHNQPRLFHRAGEIEYVGIRRSSVVTVFRRGLEPKPDYPAGV
jgi:hypothetical protein